VTRFEIRATDKIRQVTPHDSPSLAFSVPEHASAPLEIQVNFGVFAGRQATLAEIDRLAVDLLDLVGAVSIIAEERHEISHTAEASVHQVRIELRADVVPRDQAERDELEEQLLERADYWARRCIAERHSDLSDL
jgi:hypothetical protein